MAETLTIRTASSTEVVKIAVPGPQGPKGDKGDPGDAARLPLSTIGDTLYRGAIENQRLPIGTSGQILKVSAGGIPEWGAAPATGVTSVALASSDLTITGSPITSSGTITANIAANAVTLEKLQTISSEHLLGRHGSGNGGVQQVGLGTGLTMTGSNVAVTYGTTAGTACQGNDSRLSDARTPTAHTHVVADVTDLSLNKVPEARQTYNITSTNSGSPTQVDAQSAFQNVSGSIDCVVVLNNTTGIVYANIVVPDLLNTPGSQRGRVIIEATTSGSGDITNFRIDAEGTIVYPIVGYGEILPSKRLVFVWTGNNWNLECLHTASTPVQIYLPNAAGTLALTSDITKTAVGLGNVTNNAQVTSVSGTAPIVSSGGTTPAISISAASTSAAGSMSAADKTKLDGIATSANNYTHPNHTGDVTSVGDGATTIAANAVTNAKLAQIATSTIKGRATSGTGNVEDLSSAQVLTILGLLGAIKDMKVVSPSSDVTATSSTTLTNVSGMSFSVAANTTYLILTNLQVNCGSGGYNCELSFPSILNNGGTASGFGIQLPGNNAVAGLSTTTATTVKVSNRGAAQTTPSFSILLVRTDSTGGTANFQWAQNQLSSPTSTILTSTRALIIPLTT